MAEKEYIERGALLQYAKEYAPAFSAAFEIIALPVPAADVVAVVRCKDCKYYKTSPLLYPKTKRKFCYKVLKSNGIAVGHGFNETDFCSYGERKGQ